MLLDIYNELIQYLNTAYPDYTIGNYTNEFENDGAWTPSFPALFIELREYNPLFRSTSSNIIKKMAGFNLYLGIKDTTILDDKLGLTAIESLFNNLDDANITVAENTYNIKLTSIRFYNRKVTARAYLITIEIV